MNGLLNQFHAHATTSSGTPSHASESGAPPSVAGVPPPPTPVSEAPSGSSGDLGVAAASGPPLPEPTPEGPVDLCSSIPGGLDERAPVRRLPEPEGTPSLPPPALEPVVPEPIRMVVPPADMVECSQDSGRALDLISPPLTSKRTFVPDPDMPSSSHDFH